MSYRLYSVVAKHEVGGPVVKFCQHGEHGHPNHWTAVFCMMRNRRVTKANHGPFVWGVRDDRPNR